MNCAFHPSVPAAGYCPRCGRPLCEACLQATQSTGVCSACLAGAVHRRFPTGLIVGIAVAVIVLIILVGIGLAGFFYFVGSQQSGEAGPPITVESMDQTLPEPVAPTAQPGEEAALAFAYARQPEWVAVIASHSGDWHSAHVAIGPSVGDWRTFLDLQWNEELGHYELVDEGPIAYEEGKEEIPDIYQPGEEVAQEAALGETPDWVAKVTSHSPDWKTATVWIGPPQSEFLDAVELRWNDELDCYEIVGAEPVPYP